METREQRAASSGSPGRAATGGRPITHDDIFTAPSHYADHGSIIMEGKNARTSVKRKDPPFTIAHGQAPGNARKAQKRVRTYDARLIAAQTSDKALQNGELDVGRFVKAREWEIRALEAGMKGAK